MGSIWFPSETRSTFLTFNPEALSSAAGSEQKASGGKIIREVNMSNITKLRSDTPGSQFNTSQTRIRSGTLPTGITVKMDTFARYVADGLSLAEAYRRSFNTANMKSRTISNDASRLARHPGVTAAVEAYRAEIEARNRMGALERSERIWERLWHLIEDADVSPAVKVRALDLAARLAGMFKAPMEEKSLSVGKIEKELLGKLRTYGA